MNVAALKAMANGTIDNTKAAALGTVAYAKTPEGQATAIIGTVCVVTVMGVMAGLRAAARAIAG